MLNSKNDYVENCISRVMVEEDKFLRKKREREEELEEILAEEMLTKFAKEKFDCAQIIEKEKKHENIPEGGKENRKTEEVTPNPDYNLEDLEIWWEWATEECKMVKSKSKVEQLRDRMRRESEFITEWMNKNREKGKGSRRLEEIVETNSQCVPVPTSILPNYPTEHYSLQMTGKEDNKVSFEDNPDVSEWWERVEMEAARTGRLSKAIEQQARTREMLREKERVKEERLLVASLKQLESKLNVERKREEIKSREKRKRVAARLSEQAKVKYNTNHMMMASDDEWLLDSVEASNYVPKKKDDQSLTPGSNMTVDSQNSPPSRKKLRLQIEDDRGQAEQMGGSKTSRKRKFSQFLLGELKMKIYFSQAKKMKLADEATY